AAPARRRNCSRVCRAPKASLLLSSPIVRPPPSPESGIGSARLDITAPRRTNQGLGLTSGRLDAGPARPYARAALVRPEPVAPAVERPPLLSRIALGGYPLGGGYGSLDERRAPATV